METIISVDVEVASSFLVQIRGIICRRGSGGCTYTRFRTVQTVVPQQVLNDEIVRREMCVWCAAVSALQTQIGPQSHSRHRKTRRTCARCRACLFVADFIGVIAESRYAVSAVTEVCQAEPSVVDEHSGAHDACTYVHYVCIRPPPSLSPVMV